MADQDLLGTRVGHFRIVDLLGRGGMGSVYVGFDERLQRRVALKVLREGQLDEEAKLRFLREARVLSQLRHPHICQIHEFLEGAGREFLVLELIDGRNLQEVIASGPEAALRMRIARQLAEVLVATHAKGIIHRDLKPANVVVTGEGEVKVLDFGLARGQVDTEAETTRRLGEEAETSAVSGTDYAVTRMGVVVGTLTYMSPEQARGEPVTTASDIYSLGLVLQELFTGRSACVRSGNALDQLARAKAGESAAVTGLDRELTALINRLKDPAPALRPTALDTLEWLDRIRDRPRKKRRRALAWAGAALLAAVAAATSYQAWRIRQEAARANREAASAREVSDFLVKIFENANPEHGGGESVTARELLDRAARDLERRVSGQPLIRARLEGALANVYATMGSFQTARSLAERSLATRRSALSPADPAVAESLTLLGAIRTADGDYPEALKLLRSAAEIQERGPARGSAAALETLVALGNCERFLGQLAEAEGALERALRIGDTGREEDEPVLVEVLDALAILRRDQGRDAEAEALLLRQLAISEKVWGRNSPALATVLNNLGWLYADLKRYREAESLFVRSISMHEKAYGPEHPNLPWTLSNLATLYRDEGKYSEAEPLFLRSIAIDEKAFGPGSIAVAQDLVDLAEMHVRAASPGKAAPIVARALRIFEATPPTDSFTRFWNAKALWLSGRTEEARTSARALIAEGYRRKDFREFCAKLDLKPR